MSFEVVAFRIATGEEIIGRFTPPAPGAGVLNKEDDTVIVLEKVRHVILTQTPDGGLATMLGPWSLSNVDGSVKLNKSAIVAFLNPSAEAVADYMKRTSSIALASAI